MLSQMLPRTTIVLALLFMLPFADADAYCNGSVNLARTCFNVDNSTGQCLSEFSSVYPHYLAGWMLPTHLNDGIAPIERREGAGWRSVPSRPSVLCPQELP